MIKKILKSIDFPIWKFILIQVVCVIFMVFYTISSLIFPMAISEIIDKGLLERNLDTVLSLLIVILLSGLIMLIFQYLQILSYVKLAQTIIAKVKNKVFSKLLLVNLNFWKQNGLGNVIRTIEQDVSQIENVLGAAIGRFMVNIFVAVSILGLLLYKNRAIGIAMLVISIFFALAQWLIGKIIQNSMTELRNDMGEMSAFINEAIAKIYDVILAGYSNKLVKRFYDINENIKDKTIDQTKKMALSSVIGALYNIISTLICIGIGAAAVFQNKLSIGDIFAITMYIQRLYTPLITLGDSYLNIKKAKPYIDRVLMILESKDIMQTGTYIPKQSLKGDIKFCNVNFEYEKNKKVLENFDLDISNGKFVVILGDNGTGKTTLIRLLTKVCICTGGTIYVDGVNINKYENQFLFTQIGTMLQGNYFMSGTLREIVNPNEIPISDHKIEEYFENVGVDLYQFSDGLNTKIMQNNINISGGEAQKLSIVRLLIEDKPIILLDEPTAALDNESEAEICCLLRKLLKGKTIIVITHRRKILEFCDSIVHLNDK